MQGRHFLPLIGTLAAAAGSAHAVSLNPNGLGQVLLFPYYTVNQHDTLLTITNQSDVGKLVKVRVREGLNGRVALDVFVFLSANDSWVAGIGADAATGGAAFSTNDHSCTLPALASARPLSTAEFSGDATDDGPTDPSRTREGWIEVIAAADIVPASPTSTAITQVQTDQPGNGMPPGCASLSLPAVFGDLQAPAATLHGSGVIINVAQGTFYGYTADAIAGFTDVLLLDATSGPDAPTLAQANSADSSLTARAHLMLDDGTPLDVDYAKGIDAVSAVLMKTMISNEYVADPALGGNTDWVLTYPTRQFYVDPRYAPDLPIHPFIENVNQGHSITSGDTHFFDRGGQLFSADCAEGSPACTKPPVLMRVVNVVSFAERQDSDLPLSGVLVSPEPPRMTYSFLNTGRAELNFATFGQLTQYLPSGITLASHSVDLQGLPTIGFMAYNIINTNAAPGLLANYGGTFRYRSTLSCVPADGQERCQ